MAAKKKQFPKEIFVQIEGELGEEYFLVEEAEEMLTDGKVAIYKLEEILTAKNKVELI